MESLYASFFFDLGPRLLFLLAALPSAVAVVLVLAFIRDRPQGGSRIFKGLSYKDLSRNFWLDLMLSSVFALGSFSYSFLLLYPKHFGIAEPTGPVLYLTFTLVAAVSSVPFGRLSDRVGRKSVLFLSFVRAAVCAVFLVARSLLEILLVFVLYGLHKAGIETIQRAFAAELSPAEFRASTYGGFQLAIGLCALPSSFIAGIL